MKTEKRQKGDFGEELACKFLTENGYEIIARNFFTRYGELDIVASYEDTIVFVEVKTRKPGGNIRAAESVTPAKQLKCCKSAMVFLDKNKLFDNNIRFDCVEVYADIGYLDINHIKNAFMYVETF